jgi:hypothetical protein
VLVCEPDQFGVKRTHAQLAFGVRLVERGGPNRNVAADDDRTPASLNDDHLHAACVAGRPHESQTRKQLELAVDRDVTHAGCVNPLANGVVVLTARVLELPTLNVDRPPGEEVVAAAVVEVEVCVLTTMSMPARSKSCSLRGRRRGSRSASTRASGWSMTYT